MALLIEALSRIDQARAELAPFQARLTGGEIYRATAVFERAAEVWTDKPGNTKGIEIGNMNGHPPIFRIDNKASTAQASLTILLERHDPAQEGDGHEVVLLGAVRTDQLEQAIEGFVQRGYEFREDQQN